MIYFVDALGNYLGAWDIGGPDGGIAVPIAPEDAQQVWDFDAEAWGSVPKTIPSRVNRRGALLALLAVGKLDAVKGAIEAIEDSVTKQAAQIEFDNHYWDRDNPWIETLGSAIGLTSEEIDDLFIAADAA